MERSFAKRNGLELVLLSWFVGCRVRNEWITRLPLKAIPYLAVRTYLAETEYRWKAERQILKQNNEPTFVGIAILLLS